MTERMGFETNRRIVWDWHNEPTEGYGYKFRSKGEYKWATWLELQKQSGDIWAWEYEPYTFEFEERRRKRGIYTPDFKVYTCAPLEIEWHELKPAWFRQTDIYKWKQFAWDFGKLSNKKDKERLVLIVPNRPTHSIKKMIALEKACKYVDAVDFCGPIFSQLGL